MSVAWERDPERTAYPTVREVMDGVVCFVCVLIGLGGFVLLMAVLSGR